IVIPMVQALLLSVMAESGGLSLDNFRRMVADLNFSDAWRNTLLLLILIVPLQIVLALVMPLLINSRFRGHGIFLYIYAIPLAISDLAAGILWLAVFTERGYLNSTLQNAGVIDQPVLWLSFDNFAGILSAIVIAESWRATALVLVILIAGLQLIPRDFFEAADLFGANRLRRTVHVVLPLLRPSLQSALIIRTIFAFHTAGEDLRLSQAARAHLALDRHDAILRRGARCHPVGAQLARGRALHDRVRAGARRSRGLCPGALPVPWARGLPGGRAHDEDVHDRDLVERGVRRDDPHAADAHAAGAGARVPLDVAPRVQVRGRTLHGPSGDRVHLPDPQIPDEPLGVPLMSSIAIDAVSKIFGK